VALPENGVQVETAVDAFRRCGARIPEREGAEAPGQRADEIRYEDLAAERQCADARRDHDRSAAEVVVVPDRITGMQPGANVYWKAGETLGDPVAWKKWCRMHLPGRHGAVLREYSVPDGLTPQGDLHRAVA